MAPAQNPRLHQNAEEVKLELSHARDARNRNKARWGSASFWQFKTEALCPKQAQGAKERHAKGRTSDEEAIRPGRFTYSREKISGIVTLWVVRSADLLLQDALKRLLWLTLLVAEVQGSSQNTLRATRALVYYRYTSIARPGLPPCHLHEGNDYTNERDTILTRWHAPGQNQHAQIGRSKTIA